LSKDKAGRSYWAQFWEDERLPKAVDPRIGTLDSYMNHRFHGYFCKAFSSIETRNQKLLEVGGARSAWLPYFAKEFGFEVSGIDYSELGCQQAMQILSNEGVKGEIVCADFFSPPEHMLGAFDVVVSFGVAEHFEDTTGCVSAFSRFLKPGGFMVTVIPSLAGLLGKFQKLINRAALDVHVPLDRAALLEAHSGSHLEVISCDHFLFASMSIINIENLRSTPFYEGAVRLRSWLSKAAWAAEMTIPLLGPNRWTSPYIVCVAKKPCA
jgi:SAM-dependent methyltransferase